MERRSRLPLVLFLFTVATTVTAGAFYEGINPFAEPLGLVKGVPFSTALLLILGTHEMGHYLASKRHGVRATLPFFIPAPPFPPMIGTFGAVIKMKSPIMTRRALVDIGASGPLAGFVVAVLVLAAGLAVSDVRPAEPQPGLFWLGSSILFDIMSGLIIGPVPEGHDIYLNSVAFAGWIGLFITSMNLLPIGQLDGGHIVYALLGGLHRTVSVATVAVLLVLGNFTWPGWIVWALLGVIIGVGHPPVLDGHRRLDARRKALGAASLIVFVLTFIPSPFYIITP
ncbi:MAG TPA: site-2 protease family protein [Deltaproteobacteria bacterium]|nr:site-2 protease family protein [Deltaproteobacteria bacterium]